MVKNSLKALVGVAVTGAAVVGFAAPASAAGQDATINNNEFVFFFNSNYAGSYSDFAAGKSSLAGYTFIKPGLNGYGVAVKNNSASVANYKSQRARVYYNSDFGGAYDQVGADAGRNLVNTYNDNASFRWI